MSDHLFETKLLAQPAAFPARAAFQDEVAQDRQTLLKLGMDRVLSPLISDEESRKEVSQLAASGAKTAALFFRGKVGWSTAIGLSILDEIDPSTTTNEMLVDGTLGTLKGIGTKSIFAATAKRNWDIAPKAVVMGVGSRLVDTTLTRKMYFDKDGRLSVSAGLNKSLTRSSEPDALLSDIAIGAAAHGLFGLTNWSSCNALAKSKFLGTVLTGTSFGVVSGASNEIIRQETKGEQFDISKIARKALLHGAVDTMAGLPAGFQASPAARQNLVETFRSLRNAFGERWSGDTTAPVHSYPHLRRLMKDGGLTTKDVLACAVPDNFINNGGFSMVYRIPQMPDYVLSVRRGFAEGFVPEKPVMRRVEDPAPDLNFGQSVATILFGSKRHPTTYARVLKKVEGDPMGIVGWKQMTPAQQLEVNARQVKLAASMPQAAFNDFAAKLKLAEDRGLLWDNGSGNNVLLNRAKRQFNLVDVDHKNTGTDVEDFRYNETTRHSLADLVVPLCGWERFMFSRAAQSDWSPSRDWNAQHRRFISTRSPLAAEYRTIISKAIIAAKKAGLPLEPDGHLNDIFRTAGLSQEYYMGIVQGRK